MFGDPTGGNLIQQLASISTESLEGAPPPSDAFVAWLHAQASTSKPQDLHHTQGFTEFTVSPGNHRHNGKDSLTIIPTGEYPLTDLSASPVTSDIVAAVNALNKLARTYLGAG